MRAIFSCECVRKTLGRAVPVVYRQSDMSRHVSGGPIGKDRGDRKKGRSARYPQDGSLLFAADLLETLALKLENTRKECALDSEA